ncbi:hypothetical protein [Haloterrigena salinisoli]
MLETLESGETESISVTGECESDLEIAVTRRGDGVRTDRAAELDCGG